MMTTLSPTLLTSLNQISRPFQRLYPGGIGQLFQDILTEIAGGTVGCTSLGSDIDSLCLGGGSFSYDPDASAAAGGLSFVYGPGQIRAAATVINTAGATLTLAGSATNYVEVSAAGVVSSNLVGFTAGRYALYTVVTASAAILTVTNAKTLISWTPPASVTGALLSTTAASRSAHVPVGTLTTTATYLTIAPCTGTVTAASLVSPLAVAASDANYWTVSAVTGAERAAGLQPAHWHRRGGVQSRHHQLGEIRGVLTGSIMDQIAIENDGRFDTGLQPVTTSAAWQKVGRVVVRGNDVLVQLLTAGGTIASFKVTQSAVIDDTSPADVAAGTDFNSPSLANLAYVLPAVVLPLAAGSAVQFLIVGRPVEITVWAQGASVNGTTMQMRGTVHRSSRL